MLTKLMGVRIKELRERLGESQEAFANRIEMSRSYFAEVETGKRNISARNILAITNGLGVTLAEFFDSELFDQLYPRQVRLDETPRSLRYAYVSLPEIDSEPEENGGEATDALPNP